MEFGYLVHVLSVELDCLYALVQQSRTSLPSPFLNHRRRELRANSQFK